VDELMAAIRRFCDGWNQRCRPFTWTKSAEEILASWTANPTRATQGTTSSRVGD
jgi:hypothetical protein